MSPDQLKSDRCCFTRGRGEQVPLTSEVQTLWLALESLYIQSRLKEHEALTALCISPAWYMLVLLIWDSTQKKRHLKPSRWSFRVGFLLTFSNTLQAYITHTKSSKAKLSDLCDSKDTALPSLLWIRINSWFPKSNSLCQVWSHTNVFASSSWYNIIWWETAFRRAEQKGSFLCSGLSRKSWKCDSSVNVQSWGVKEERSLLEAGWPAFERVLAGWDKLGI